MNKCPDCQNRLFKNQNNCVACGWQGNPNFEEPECRYCGSLFNLNRSAIDGFCCKKCWSFKNDEKSANDLMVDAWIQKECARDDAVGAAFRVACDPNENAKERAEARNLYLELKNGKNHQSDYQSFGSAFEKTA